MRSVTEKMMIGTWGPRHLRDWVRNSHSRTGEKVFKLITSEENVVMKVQGEVCLRVKGSRLKVSVESDNEKSLLSWPVSMVLRSEEVRKKEAGSWG